MWHHKKHLMGYFEFLHSTRIIGFPLNISGKLHWKDVFKKLEKAETHHLLLLIRYNTLATWRTILTFKQTGTTSIFSSGHQSYNWPHSGPLCWQNPCSGCNSGFDLVVVLEYISFNFAATPRKSLRFTRFIRSSVNRPAVVLTNNYQSFCFMCPVRSCHVPSFLQVFVPNDSAFALLSTPVARTDGSADQQMWTSYKRIKFNGFS